MSHTATLFAVVPSLMIRSSVSKRPGCLLRCNRSSLGLVTPSGGDGLSMNLRATVSMSGPLVLANTSCHGERICWACTLSTHASISPGVASSAIVMTHSCGATSPLLKAADSSQRSAIRPRSKSSARCLHTSASSRGARASAVAKANATAPGSLAHSAHPAHCRCGQEQRSTQCVVNPYSSACDAHQGLQVAECLTLLRFKAGPASPWGPANNVCSEGSVV